MFALSLNGTTHYTALDYTTLNFTTLLFTTLHCTVLQCNAQNFTSLHYTPPALLSLHRPADDLSGSCRHFRLLPVFRHLHNLILLLLRVRLILAVLNAWTAVCEKEDFLFYLFFLSGSIFFNFYLIYSEWMKLHVYQLMNTFYSSILSLLHYSIGAPSVSVLGTFDFSNY